MLKPLGQWPLEAVLLEHLESLFPGIGQWEVSGPNPSGTVSIHYQGLRLDLEHIGEGLDGYYDPEDPEDVPLLRLDLYHQHPLTGELTELPGASSCSLVDANAPWGVRLAAAATMFEHLRAQVGPAPAVEAGEGLGQWGRGLEHDCAVLGKIRAIDFMETHHLCLALARAGGLAEALLPPSGKASVPRM